MTSQGTTESTDDRSFRGDDARAVVQRLREVGHQAYFAGGCVRDMLLGAEPKDWDVATSAFPETVRELFNNTQAVGAAFGVILVRHRSSVIEVATFRADMEYRDGRHPQGVRFTTAEEDAQRRDFTINGLFYDPADRRVIDFVAGREDLDARLIRAIGDPDRRFDEDHLRLLRAVRFSARLDFSIERATGEAIRRHAPQLKRISPERIADELRSMLTPPTRGRAWAAIWDMDLAAQIFRWIPDVSDTRMAGPETSIVAEVAIGERISFGLALAAGLTCLGLTWHNDARYYSDAARLPRVTRALRQGLKISNEESADFGETLAGVEVILSGQLRTVAQYKRFLARPTARHTRQLVAAIARTREVFANVVYATEQVLVQHEQTEFAPPPMITGDDLTSAGLTPGPAFKRVLDAIYDCQLEGAVTTKEEALLRAIRLAQR